ncbi:MAG: hypothetical protein OEZ65_15875 [Gemmatimonadota bacterium]|nr:hypothetical protein [Gemmatimonadota bacterium]
MAGEHQTQLGTLPEPEAVYQGMIVGVVVHPWGVTSVQLQQINCKGIQGVPGNLVFDHPAAWMEPGTEVEITVRKTRERG